MPIIDKSYKQSQQHSGMIRSPARSFAVGLSFFLAACSTSVVRVSSDTAITTEKSPLAIQPVTLAVSSASGIIRGRDALLECFLRQDIEQLAPVSSGFRQSVRVNFGSAVPLDDHLHEVYSNLGQQHLFRYTSTITQPQPWVDTLHLERLSASPQRGCSSFWGRGVVGEQNSRASSVVALGRGGRHLSGRLGAVHQPRSAEPLLGESLATVKWVSGQTSQADFCVIHRDIDQRTNICISSPAILSGSPPEALLLAQKRNG